jgi:hypothetical protein
VRHFLYFSDLSTADAAAADLRARGFQCDVRESGTREEWLVLVRHETTAEEIEEIRDQLERVAAAHGGEYDGWEA